MSRLAICLALMVVMGAAFTGLAEDRACPQCLGGWMDAPIKIEVFSDFQCPACRDLFLNTMKFVLKDYCTVDKVCVIYHEFPLAMHPYAREAARYALAAQRLGRQQWFSVMEALYLNQEVWSKDGTVQLAVSRGLSPADLEKVIKMKDDPSIIEAIEQDIALGQKRQVRQTPTMFVMALNKEQKVDGGLPFNVLKDFFDRVVK